jgi:quinol monooxygenase YgiN
MLRMRVRAGCAERFEAMIAEVAEAVAARPGNLGQRMFRADSESGTYYVFSDWADEQAFWEHERSAAHRERIALLRAVREESTMVAMWQVSGFPLG